MKARWLLWTPLLVAACAIAPAPSPTPTLTGVTWELHSIQSMDDAQGTLRIDDPRRFTFRLEADGRAALRLDCNRGTANWESESAGDGSTGRFQFGPIAATRALCAPPQLDARVTRDLTFVRGYRFIDGNLFLTLMADGAIYEWRAARQ